MNQYKGYLKNTARVVLVAAILLGGSICINLLTFSTSAVNSDLEHQRLFNDNYKVFSLTIPDAMEFCGEKVPMEKLDVRERLDRELLVNTYWQSSTLIAHKRANRWFPLIERILEREGVPDDMKFLAVIESGLSNVVSPAGATGFWQFMRETGSNYGLEINGEVDERYDVEKSTVAACKYLKASYDVYGNWALAAASYNLGVGGVNKQMGRQKQESYFKLQLNDETARYVFRMLAMKEVLRDPERYGFHLREKDLYQPYKTRTVTVATSISDLAQFAIDQHTDYRTLKLLNPWLRESYLNNKSGKTYSILLPGKDFDDGGEE